jgi:hypothetical protein
LTARSSGAGSRLTVAALLIAVATVACQSRAEGSVAGVTAPPCDTTLLVDALDAIPDVVGYRFERVIDSFGPDPSAPGPIDERERVWTSRASHGAYLAPDRFFEIVDDVEPDHEPEFWQVVQIGDQAWLDASHNGVRSWQPTLPGLERAHKLDAINDFVAPEDRLEFVPGPAPAGLSGEGGCVMAATVVGGRFVAVRMDRDERRVTAWLWQAGDAAADGMAQRESLVVDYEEPLESEFAAPDVGG